MGRRQAIALDARIELEQQDGSRLVGLLEIDLRTMSHRRLAPSPRLRRLRSRQGLAERQHFCPVLLLATIAPRRAIAFLDSLSRELERGSELRCQEATSVECAAAVVARTCQRGRSGLSREMDRRACAG
jgi:hypothetical protein